MTSSLPEKMRIMAVRSLKKGGSELIEAKATVPQPAAHEVLLKISHAGVNRADILQRKGMYPPPAGAPQHPGLEVAGEVVQVGSEVSEWQRGDKVCALLAGGGYGQYAAVHAAHCLPVPHGWSMEEAAAFPEIAFTVWMALGAEAKLRPSESLLVHGGASGIGMMAIQYASSMGAKVYTTASTPEKCAQCETWGATKAIHYTKDDFVEVVTAATKDAGVNVVLDFIGGDYVARNLKCLSQDGRMVSLAFLGGAKVDSLNLAPLLLKQILWKGATLRARTDAQKAEYARAIRGRMWPFIEQNKIRPRIDRVFSLPEAQKAHEYMEQNLNIGKIVLQV